MSSLRTYLKTLKTYEWLLLLGFVASAIGLLVQGLSNSAARFWDFRVYYSAASCYLEGLDPYNMANLFKQHRNVAPLPYLYPPLALYYFLPFGLLKVKTAIFVYVSIKIIALVALFRAWLKIYPDKKYLIGLLWLALLGFNAALHKDFITGNISVFEQLAIWWGIYYLLKDRLWPFAILILLISTVKLLPIVFLGFLLFSPSRKKWQVLFTSIGIFGIYLLANRLFEPALTEKYILAFADSVPKEGGITNASSFEFFKTLFKQFLPNADLKLAAIPYLLFAVTVAIITSVQLFRLSNNTSYRVRLHTLLTLCMALILVLPRLKDYSYILAIFPVFYLSTQYHKKVGIALLVILACLSAKNVTIPFFSQVIDLVWSYYTLLIAFVAWLLYLRLVNTIDVEVPDGNDSTTSPEIA